MSHERHKYICQFEGKFLTLYHLYSLLASERSRSLYAIAVPSVVSLSSVTFVQPTQPVEFFGNFSLPFGTLAIH